MMKWLLSFALSIGIIGALWACVEWFRDHPEWFPILLIGFVAVALSAIIRAELGK